MSNITVSFTAANQEQLKALMTDYLGAGATVAAETAKPEADKADAPATGRGRARKTATKTATATKAEDSPKADTSPVLDYEKDIKPKFVKLAALPEGKKAVADIISSYGVKSAMDIPAEALAELSKKLDAALAEGQPADEETGEDSFGF